MQSRKRVFLGLGSNVGDRIENILRALEELSRLGELVKVSTVYESEPWGVKEQPTFLNCAVEMKTSLSPEELLSRIKDIERRLGRVERFHWGPREIDIDIILYDELVIESDKLKVPHPFIEKRDFVLVPLLELDEDLVNPKSGVPYRTYLERVRVALKPFCCIRREGGTSVGSLP